MNRKSGMITVVQALLLGPFSVALLAMQDWYVDVNAPGCALGRPGTGTQINPFCNIQDAADAAADGDTIHIAPGTYFENVLLKEDLTLIGTGGPAVTILDGMSSGSVVRVRDTAATMMGLTLTNGTGTPYGTYGAYYGGGLFVYSPSLLSPVVTVSDCSLAKNSSTIGGGVAGGTPTNSSPISLMLTNTTVSGNTTTAFYTGEYSSYYLPCTSDYEWATGGGIHCYGALTLTNSSVSDNAAVHPYGYPFSANGGGIAVNPGPLIVSGSVITGNHSNKLGGGISTLQSLPPGCAPPGGTAIVSNSIVSANTAGFDGLGSMGEGGGIFSHGDLTVVNSVIGDNDTGTPGCPGCPVSKSGGIYHGLGVLTLTNATVIRNRTGGIWVVGSSAYVSNSILSGNRMGFGRANEFEVTGPYAATVGYTLIAGGWPGVGNIDANPLFVDPMSGDFRLTPGSPCIDAGDNFPVPMNITTDIRGLPRFIDDPLTPDTGVGRPTVDMGAFEFFRRVRNARSVPVPAAPPRVIR